MRKFNVRLSDNTLIEIQADYFKLDYGALEFCDTIKGSILAFSAGTWLSVMRSDMDIIALEDDEDES